MEYIYQVLLSNSGNPAEKKPERVEEPVLREDSKKTRAPNSAVLNAWVSTPLGLNDTFTPSENIDIDIIIPHCSKITALKYQ